MASEVFTARESSIDTKNAEGKQRYPLSMMVVNDSDWRRTTGRSRPSGNGRWAFSIGSREAFDDIDKAFWFDGKYSDALKAAKKEAQKRGKYSVYVMG